MENTIHTTKPDGRGGQPLRKVDPTEFTSYVTDASHLVGAASAVYFPSDEAQVALILREANDSGAPVTVAGNGTGLTGGRVPFEGVVLSTERLDKIIGIKEDAGEKRLVVQPGVTLKQVQEYVEAQGLFYAPDPTERLSFIGGNVATAASGARSFKYGTTREHVKRLRVILANGEVLDVRRGAVTIDGESTFRIVQADGSELRIPVPDFRRPPLRKNVAGYFLDQNMDLIDLFIGSEGTLGVISEIELKLLPKPSHVLSAILFLPEERSCLALVAELRELAGKRRSVKERQPALDLRAIEYFDRHSLAVIRERYRIIPKDANSAVFIEQEFEEEDENEILSRWLTICEGNSVLVDESWFSIDERDYQRFKEFRHAVPEKLLELGMRTGFRLVTTDFSVPDEHFEEMMAYYDLLLGERFGAPGEIRFTLFGHIGDSHLHAVMVSRSEKEYQLASQTADDFAKRAVQLGGTVAAEHGIGKTKHHLLRLMYSDEMLGAMRTIKYVLDPKSILGKGCLFLN